MALIADTTGTLIQDTAGVDIADTVPPAAASAPHPLVSPSQAAIQAASW